MSCDSAWYRPHPRMMEICDAWSIKGSPRANLSIFVLQARVFFLSPSFSLIVPCIPECRGWRARPILSRTAPLLASRPPASRLPSGDIFLCLKLEEHTFEYATSAQVNTAVNFVADENRSLVLGLGLLTRNSQNIILPSFKLCKQFLMSEL